jgi:hypothetical protein
MSRQPEGTHSRCLAGRLMGAIALWLALKSSTICSCGDLIGINARPQTDEPANHDRFLGIRQGDDAKRRDDPAPSAKNSLGFSTSIRSFS